MFLTKPTLPVLLVATWLSCNVLPCVSYIMTFEEDGVLPKFIECSETRSDTTENLIPNGWHGFNWVNTYFERANVLRDCGPKSVLWAGNKNYVAYNGYGSPASFEVPPPSGDFTFSLEKMTLAGVRSDNLVVKIEGFDATNMAKGTKTVTIAKKGNPQEVGFHGGEFSGLSKVVITTPQSGSHAVAIDDIVYHDDETITFEDRPALPALLPANTIQAGSQDPYRGFQWSTPQFVYRNKPTGTDWQTDSTKDKHDAYTIGATANSPAYFQIPPGEPTFSLRSMRLASSLSGLSVVIQGFGTDQMLKATKTVAFGTLMPGTQAMARQTVIFDETFEGLAKVTFHTSTPRSTGSDQGLFLDDIVVVWDNVEGEEAAVDEYVVGKDGGVSKESIIAGCVVFAVILIVSLTIVVYCGRKNQWSCLRKACGRGADHSGEQEAEKQEQQIGVDDAAEKEATDVDETAKSAQDNAVENV